jgi:hypothetical protein
VILRALVERFKQLRSLTIARGIRFSDRYRRDVMRAGLSTAFGMPPTAHPRNFVWSAIMAQRTPFR